MNFVNKMTHLLTVKIIEKKIASFTPQNENPVEISRIEKNFYLSIFFIAAFRVVET
jgi:hypothetical protein